METAHRLQEVMPPAPPREAPLHRGPVAKDGPMSQGRQLSGLSSRQQHLRSRLQFQLHDTSSHLDNLSSHVLCSWGPSVGSASLYMGFSGDEGFTGHVRFPVLAWPWEGMLGAWQGQDPAAQ